MLKHGLPLYHIERVIQETGELFRDDEHIIFVNGAYEGDDPVGRLMADFRTPDPEAMHYKPLAQVSDYFKHSEEGVAAMCKEMERLVDKGRAEGEAKGRAEGEARYAEKLSRLHQALTRADRGSEFITAATDKRVAERLLEEFGI